MTAKLQSVWKTGLCVEDIHPSIQHEVTATTEEFKVQWRPGTQKKLLVVDQPNRFVVGAKICSHWDAGTGGWWRLKGGGLLQHRLSVEVETQESRGCHWSLCVYSVDNELYKRI
jgi:hypothetical protein